MSSDPAAVPNREDGVTLEQIAADFGVHPVTLSKWMRQSDVDDGNRPGPTGSESAELRDARRRIRSLE
jgi:transposase